MQGKYIISEELAEIFNAFATRLEKDMDSKVRDFLVPLFKTISAGQAFPFQSRDQSIKIFPAYQTCQNKSYTILYTSNKVDLTWSHSKEIFTKIVDFIQDNLNVQYMNSKVTEEDILLFKTVYDKATTTLEGLPNSYSRIKLYCSLMLLEKLHRLKLGDVMIQSIQYNNINVSLYDLLKHFPELGGLKQFSQLGGLKVISSGEVIRRLFAKAIYDRTCEAIKTNHKLQTYEVVGTSIESLSLENIYNEVKRRPKEELKRYFIETVIERCLLNTDSILSADGCLYNFEQYKTYINSLGTKNFIRELCETDLKEYFDKNINGIRSLKIGKTWKDVVTRIQSIQYSQSTYGRALSFFKPQNAVAFQAKIDLLERLKTFIISLGLDIDEAFASETSQQEIPANKDQALQQGQIPPNTVSEELAQHLNNIIAEKEKQRFKYKYQIEEHFLKVCQSIKSGDKFPFVKEDIAILLFPFKWHDFYAICIFTVKDQNFILMSNSTISINSYNLYVTFVQNNISIKKDISQKVTKCDIELFQKIYNNQMSLLQSNPKDPDVHFGLQFLRLLAMLKPGDDLICGIQYAGISILLANLIQKIPELENIECIKKQKQNLQQEIPANKDQVQQEIPANSFVIFIRQNPSEERVVDERDDAAAAFHGFHKTDYLNK